MEHLDSTVNPPVVSVVSEMSAVVRSLLDTRRTALFVKIFATGSQWPLTIQLLLPCLARDCVPGISNGCN